MDETGKVEKTGKFRKRIVTFFLALCVAIAAAPAVGATPTDAGKAGADTASRAVRAVIPVGRTTGIKLYSDGLLVVNVSSVQGQTGDCSPAKECGLRVGDFLLKMNDTALDSTQCLQQALQENGIKPVALTVKRGRKNLSMTATPVGGTDGVYRLGAWVRDSMAGIGTLTYYDPATGLYGALGHGITDTDTARLMPLSDGSLMPASVAAVQKSVAGTPGVLTGDFDAAEVSGSVLSNTQNGVFGALKDLKLLEQQALPVARRSEIRTGKAVILSNVEGTKVRAYRVKITKLLSGKDGREMVLRVTDPALVECTGGIVQGMSGSPILQNGKIVGALTHVLVNDPRMGYGISLESMLNAAEETGC